MRELRASPCDRLTRSARALPVSPMLDDLGLDAALMFPTLASLLEVRLTDDPDLTCTVIHAFNEWLHDEWTFNLRGAASLPRPS